MAHIVGIMASLEALRGSWGKVALKLNPVAQPPAVLHPAALRPLAVRQIARLPVPPRKGDRAWARS